MVTKEEIETELAKTRSMLKGTCMRTEKYRTLKWREIHLLTELLGFTNDNRILGATIEPTGQNPIIS
jgi:hypothetical protein